ncbi:hypothetical protein [Pyruvatibacter sp.]|uniref:hypothetical protein n=1 Tax=Pyruvatibacter sp. TaxID=1981328 RepID=UPI0032678ACF
MRRYFMAAMALGLAAVLTACASSSAPTRGQVQRPSDPEAAARHDLAKQRSSITPAQLTEKLNNTTTLSHMPGHGTQIEYLGADGSAHLWYPGNKSIVKGEWMVKAGPNPNFIRSLVCFRYGANTYNPVTKKAGGKWNCTNPTRYLVFQIDDQKGDLFDLSKRDAVPLVLERDAAKAYAPRQLPILEPIIVNGKSPLQNLVVDLNVPPPGA